MGLPSQSRLKRTRDFGTVRETGQSVAGRLLILSWLPRPAQEGNKAGFTVTKRVGDSVTRNKVRRRLREIVREALPQIIGVHCIVTIPRHPSTRVEFDELRREWRRLARKAGLLPPAPAQGSQRPPRAPQGGVPENSSPAEPR